MMMLDHEVTCIIHPADWSTFMLYLICFTTDKEKIEIKLVHNCREYRPTYTKDTYTSNTESPPFWSRLKKL